MTNLQELGYDTLQNYAKKAYASREKAVKDHRINSAISNISGSDRHTQAMHGRLAKTNVTTFNKRQRGLNLVNKASNGMYGEEIELDEMSPGAPNSAHKYGKLYAKMGGPKSDNPYPKTHILHTKWNEGHDSHTSVKKEGLEEAKGLGGLNRNVVKPSLKTHKDMVQKLKQTQNDNDKTFKDWRKNMPDREITRKIVDEKFQWTSMHQGAKPTETPPKVTKGGIVDKKINEQVESFVQYISRLHPVLEYKESKGLKPNAVKISVKRPLEATITDPARPGWSEKRDSEGKVVKQEGLEENFKPGSKEWLEDQKKKAKEERKRLVKSLRVKPQKSVKEALEALFTVNAIELSGMTVQDIAQYMTSQDIEQLQEASPPGWQHVVKKLLQKGSKVNPWAIAWSMKNKGYKAHKENQISRPDYEKWYKKTGKNLAHAYNEEVSPRKWGYTRKIYGPGILTHSPKTGHVQRTSEGKYETHKNGKHTGSHESFGAAEAHMQQDGYSRNR